MINEVIFLNLPQYGSELGNFCYRYPWPNKLTIFLASLFESQSWGTSQENMIHLSRAGDTIWEMHQNFISNNNNLDPNKVSCTIGTTRGPFLLLIGIMKRLDAKITPREILGLDYFKNCYNKGLSDSDGIVPYTSQNMKSMDSDIEAVEIEKNHIHVQRLKLDDMDDCRKLYNLIKKRMNKK